MKPIFYLLIMVVGLVSVQSCNSKKGLSSHDSSPYKFDFEQSNLLSTVLEKAETENKLVFVDIYADWCLPCKLMDEDVFTHQETADFMNDNFVNYKVDGEKGEGPDLLVIYAVQAYPTLLFLDHRGRVLVKKAGAAYHSELLDLAEEALSKNDIGSND